MDWGSFSEGFVEPDDHDILHAVMSFVPVWTIMVGLQSKFRLCSDNTPASIARLADLLTT